MCMLQHSCIGVCAFICAFRLWREAAGRAVPEGGELIVPGRRTGLSGLAEAATKDAVRKPGEGGPGS